MNLGKINFFKRLYLAITDFRMYPYAQKEKLITALGYFLKIVIFISIIIGAFITSGILKEIPNYINMYKTHVPEFSITNGRFEASENIDKEINEKIYLIVNSECAYNEINNLEILETKVHDYYIILLEDSTVVGVRTHDVIQELARIQYEPEMNFTKQQILNEIENFKNSTFGKMSIWLGISLGMLITFLILKTWVLLMYTISAYIINFMFGLKLKISEYLKLVIYASTMPMILETIALILVGNISETINFISILVACVYIFYGLRAIKLDSLILGGTGKTAEERIKNALENAQRELEKQLEDLEKEEKNEQQNTDEKNEIEKLNSELKEKEQNLLKAQKEYDEVIKKAMSIATKKDIETEEKNENDKD